MNTHIYKSNLKWTGNKGKGTSSYNAYERDFTLNGSNKEHLILGSSDPSFKGNPSHYNPEELFLNAVASCHMLWYLHLCSVNNITVLTYEDNPIGCMIEKPEGSGSFTSITLHPEITINNEDNLESARQLNHEANKMCFIANSVNFEITHECIIKTS